MLSAAAGNQEYRLSVRRCIDSPCESVLVLLDERIAPKWPGATLAWELDIKAKYFARYRAGEYGAVGRVGDI
ncbi:hypothetical protein JOS77_28335 [Chromobacterium haemolyticum]|nr:hypothetical protein JOS77_28335 [Chromobacterium haemolyticum]